ncbi:hypothetical protein OsI_13312 [Oryza sativa Indica Group]|uniref:glutamate decarboxylase n=1 Tax=Oryza sativa subsp. indica TaxID=39946 RepID=B8AQP6_ORYSI|nr:hypothetical protein OsI_13312 [Oryza sativa Indica Group]
MPQFKKREREKREEKIGNLQCRLLNTPLVSQEILALQGEPNRLAFLQWQGCCVRGRIEDVAARKNKIVRQTTSAKKMEYGKHDFRLPLVKSINVSGHKYGLIYAGIGWCIWRSKEDLPEELIFHINYLGADQPTFTLNFSKGSSQVIAQYYQLIRLGFEGYKNIMENCQENAMVLKQGLEKTGRFNIVSKDNGVPLVAFSLKDSARHNEFEISDFLRRFGWIVPAYTMPPDAQHVTVLRVVIREDFSRTLAERLVLDVEKVLHELDALPARVVANGGDAAAASASEREMEKQREVISFWKRAVLAKKKTNGVC